MYYFVDIQKSGNFNIDLISFGLSLKKYNILDFFMNNYIKKNLMKKAEKFKKFCLLAEILLFLTLITACEKNTYDLMDPSSAGVWTLYSTKTGLPGNMVWDIKRDSKNNLWFTFPGYGIASYTDSKWTIFTSANSSILSNSVNSLCTTSNGGLIIGTSNGISIRSADGQWSSYKDPLVTTMKINTVKVAANGWIWIGTEGQGFYINEGSGYIKYNISPFQYVNIIEEDSFGVVWLGTGNGLIRYDGTNWSVITTSNGLPDNEVTALYCDSKQRMWIGTSGGNTVSWIDNSGMHQLSLMNGSSGTFVRDIYEDRKGNIWFATWFDGLIRYNGVLPDSFKTYNGFFENDVNAIGEDKYGNLWFGLYSKGLVKYTLPLE
jgi:ligand-binding sensor domain-containing protein